jgi:hypothetical protein
MITILMIHKVFQRIRKNTVFKDFEITKADIMELEKCQSSKNINKIQSEM